MDGLLGRQAGGGYLIMMGSRHSDWCLARGSRYGLYGLYERNWIGSHTTSRISNICVPIIARG